jgi:hypothetical protein
MSLSVTNFTSCWTASEGGATYRNTDGGTATFSLWDLTVYNVSGPSGIYTGRLSHTVETCNFISNRATAVFWLGSTGHLTIRRCCFQGNTGVLFDATGNWNGGQYSLINCYFDGAVPSAACITTRSGNIGRTNRFMTISHFFTHLCLIDDAGSPPVVASLTFRSSASLSWSSPLQITTNVARSQHFSATSELNSSAHQTASEPFSPSLELNASAWPSPSGQLTSSSHLKPQPTTAASPSPSAELTQSPLPVSTDEISEPSQTSDTSSPITGPAPSLTVSPHPLAVRSTTVASLPPTFLASSQARFSTSAALKPSSPFDDRHSGGHIPDASFEFGWVIGVAAAVVLLASVGAVFGWKHGHKEAPTAADVLNDTEAEVWMENPESLLEEQIFASVFVETHDEAMFVRI